MPNTYIKFDVYTFLFNLERGGDMQQRTIFDDNWDRRQTLFKSIISNNDGQAYTYKKGKYKYKIDVQDDFGYILRIGREQTITLRDASLEPTAAQDYPNLRVLLKITPEDQVIAIEKNTSEIQNNSTLLSGFFNHINKRLLEYGLNVRHKPQIEEGTFWEIVSQNPERITAVEFELLSPNLPAINEGVQEKIKQLQEVVGSKSAKLKLQGSKERPLQLAQDISDIADLVIVTERGGATATITINGIGNSTIGGDSTNIRRITVPNVPIHQLGQYIQALRVNHQGIR